MTSSSMQMQRHVMLQANTKSTAFRSHTMSTENTPIVFTTHGQPVLGLPWCASDHTLSVHLPFCHPSCQSAIPALYNWTKAKKNWNHHATPFHRRLHTCFKTSSAQRPWPHHLCKCKDMLCCMQIQILQQSYNTMSIEKILQLYVQLIDNDFHNHLEVS